MLLKKLRKLQPQNVQSYLPTTLAEIKNSTFAVLAKLSVK
jgi:hypothetical protein